MPKETILVYLLDEGTDAWIQCESEIVGPNVYLVGEPESYDPDDVTLQFLPGSHVRCERRTMSEGKQWPVAVERVWSPCVFCQIADRRLDPELVVLEDEHVIVCVSLQQKLGNRGHALVMPKRHIATIYDMPERLGSVDAPLMAALRLTARGVKRAFNADGVNIRQNNEQAAGQDVFHVHFHVIPRYAGDAFDAAPYERLPLELRRAQAELLKAAIDTEAAR